MNSVALPTTESSTDELLNNLRRIHRRVCLLRALGRHSEALDLEIDEQSPALSAAHDAGVAEHRTAAAMKDEAARVAQASTLAELLAPLLAEKLRESPAPLSSPAAAAPALTPAASKTPAAPIPSPSPAPSAAPSTGRAPSITDLLDGMLALESPRAAHRAS